MNVRSKNAIITFIGTVGVGKSTQIRLLKKFLLNNNVKVIDSYIKSTQGLAFLLNKFLILLGVSEKAIMPYGSVQLLPRNDLMKKLFPIWRILDFFSIIFKFLFTVYLPFLFGFTAIMEEGLMMTEFTYAKVFPRLFGLEKGTLPFVPFLLGWVMKKPNVTFVLDATDFELEKRRRKREFRQSELAVFVNLQREFMASLKRENIVFIDTTGLNASQVHENVISALETYEFI